MRARPAMASALMGAASGDSCRRQQAGGAIVIHARLFDLECLAGSLARGEAFLDRGERDRAARFCKADLRRRYLLAHAALRMTLSEAVGCHPAELSFERSALGKPRLVLNSGVPFSFSFSHSGAYAVVAYGECRDIGADVEVRRKIDRPRALSEAIMSPREHSCPLQHDSWSLIRIWAVKEAILKATGEGLSRSMTDVSLSAAPPNAPILDQLEGDDGPGSWRLAFEEPEPGVALALAVRTEDAPVEFHLEVARS